MNIAGTRRRTVTALSCRDYPLVLCLKRKSHHSQHHKYQQNKRSKCMSPSDVKAMPIEMPLGKCNCIYLSCSTLCFIQHSKKWTKKGNITKYWDTHPTKLQHRRAWNKLGPTAWERTGGILKISFPSTHGITTFFCPPGDNKYVMESGGQPGKLKGTNSEYNQWLWEIQTQ